LAAITAYFKPGTSSRRPKPVAAQTQILKHDDMASLRIVLF